MAQNDSKVDCMSVCSIGKIYVQSGSLSTSINTIEYKNINHSRTRSSHTLTVPKFFLNICIDRDILTYMEEIKIGRGRG